MIRLIQRRLIIPRGDTGSFSIPVLRNSADNIAVFTIFDEVTHTKMFQKMVPSEGDVITIAFTHSDTVNLKPGKYVWDIKYYSNPEYIDDELVNGEEIDSYYAGFSLPVCEIRETADNYLVSPEAPTATLSPQQLEIVTGAIHSLNEAIRKTQENVEHYPEIRDEDWYVWDAELGDYVSTDVRANGTAGNGIASAVLNDDYTLTLNFTDGTSFTSTSIRGQRGNGIEDIVLNNDFTLTITYIDGDSYVTPSIRGPVGATPQFSIGTVQDGAVAAASITGTAENPVLNLTLPNAHVPTKVSQLENDSGYLNTETDPTVPQWAKEPTKPSYTPQEVGALPADTFIPTKVSDLEDDSGHYIKPATGIPAADLEETYLTSFTETDPTVPSWAKEPIKPSYTPQEVGALPADTYIPQKTSDLTNDSNYAVDVNYVHTDNNYTTAEKEKLSGIAAGAEVNVNADWNATSGDAQILNKPTKVSDFTNDVGYLTEHQDISNKADKSEIPTKVSQLQNDEGYLKSFTETDPTVPAWAKAAQKPSYTAAEVGAPTIAEMNTAIGEAVGQINSFDIAVVQALPMQDISTHTIYLVPKTGETDDVYDEYIYINSKWEMVGNTQIDLSDYALKSELPTKVSELSNDSGYLTSYTETDPTVPEWAKATTKPGYTAAEVGALPSDTHIPSTTAELENNAGFITSAALPTKVSELANDAGYLTTHQDIGGKANIADLATVATSGSYSDLSNKPSIPTKVSELTNDAGYLTTHQDISGKADASSLAAVATSGDYEDLSNKPEIPVTDVQIDGTSVLSNGIANIPFASASVAGVTRPNLLRGLNIENNMLQISKASLNEIKNHIQAYTPVVPSNQHAAVFYGLATAAGDETQEISSNAIGTYTDTAKVAIKNMLGITQTLTVTVLTQDNVTVTGQTVTVRADSPEGEVYATAAYEGQPVSFSLPTGFQYYVNVSDTLDHHFNPTTVRGVIKDTNVAVTLQYSDFSTIRTAPDIKAALNVGMDLTDLVGEQITCTKGSGTLTWDVVDYDDTNKTVKLLLHDCFGTANMVFEPAQALMWCENGLAAGSYTFKNDNNQYYFTTTVAVPAGGQLRATDTTFYLYQSPESTGTLQTGTVSTTEIAGATNLGTCGQGLLNAFSRNRYGSNNIAESAIFWWLNTDAAANTYRPLITKFSRAHSYNVPGFLNELDTDFVDCVDEVDWKCSTNNVYECPKTLGGLTDGTGRSYTLKGKFCFASEKEIFGSYSGNQDGSTRFDLYNGASADDRKKYRGTSVQVWWLRSPYWNFADNERSVTSSGSASNYYANSSYAVVPACQISKDTE